MKNIITISFFILVLFSIASCKKTKEEQKVKSIHAPDNTLAIGEQIKLNITYYPKDAVNTKFIFISENPGIASVDTYGNIYGHKSGETQITITTDDKKVSCICRIKVYEKTANVSGVTLSSNSQTIEEGGGHILTATILPANAKNKNISWESSNTAVAIVDSDGMITALKCGTTDITVTTEDGNKTASCKILVSSSRQYFDPDFEKFLIKEYSIYTPTGKINPTHPKTKDCLDNCTEIKFNNFDLNLSSIKGIEYLQNLTKISVLNNNIEVIDLSTNIKLCDLDYYGKKINKVILPTDVKLRSLRAHYNLLIDISNQEDLEILHVNQCNLTKLDLSQCPKLKELSCWENKLGDFDGSSNPLLEILDISNNDILNLHINKNSKLTYLECNGNCIHELNITNNPLLTTCSCGYQRFSPKKDDPITVILHLTEEQLKKQIGMSATCDPYVNGQKRSWI